MDRGELLLAMAAASSECSSGCQSGWTTYLDSSSRSGCGTARFHDKATRQPYHNSCDHSVAEEEEDLSMISDASSGPRQQCSAGNNGDVEAGGAEDRRGRPVADAARRQSKKAAAATLQLEDTASSPAFFFDYSTATSLLGEGNNDNGYAEADDGPAMEIGNTAAFSATTTGFNKSSPLTLNGTGLDGYLQMQYSPAAAAKPMMPRRQVRRDAGETKRW